MRQHIKNQHITLKNTEEAGIDIRQLLKRCWKHWYLFVLFPAVMLSLAWTYLKYQVPIYEVKSTILIKDEKNKQGITANDLIAKEFGLNEDKKMLSDESKIMTSFTIIEKVVRDLKLDRSVLIKETLKSREIYGLESPIAIDSFVLRDTLKDFKAQLDILDDKRFELTTANGEKQTHNFGENFTNKYGSFLINRFQNTPNQSIKAFEIVCKGTEKAARETIKSINIDLPKKESNILEPTIKTAIPQKAKDILVKMVDVYNEFSLNDKKEVSNNTLAFINNRLYEIDSTLTGVEKKVENYQANEGITANMATDIGYYFSRMNEYDGELVKLEVQNAILASIEPILTKNDPNFDLLPANLDLKSVVLQNQISDYNKLVLERNRLAKVAGNDNPNLKNLTLEILSVKASIIDNIKRVKQENASLLAQTRLKNNQYVNKLGKTPRNERELADIKRQQNIKEGLYAFLLQKQEETAIALIGAVPNARIIDRPIIGEMPGMKKNIIILAGALLGGLFLGFLFVLIKSLFSNTLESEKDIAIQTPIPVIAKIAYSKKHADWVVQQGSNSLISEMFRSLRSNLQNVLPMYSQNEKGKVLIVTSAQSGEGKNYITLNLGMSLAIANKKTIIVELDLRRPKLHTSFSNIKLSIGITDYIRYEIYPNEIIQPSGKHKDLFFIHSGGKAANPSELLLDSKLELLFNYLKNNFDYIIINTPPVGLLSDAFALKPFADMTLFIARLGITKHEDIEILNDIYEKDKLPNATIVFNGLKWDNKGKDLYYEEDDSLNKNIQAHNSSIFSKKWIKNLFS